MSSGIQRLAAWSAPDYMLVSSSVTGQPRQNTLKGPRMLEKASLGCVIVSVCSLAACNNEYPLFPTLQTATVELSSAPDPAVGVPSSGVTYEVDGQVLEFDFMTMFDLVLRTPEDQAGVDITAINLSVEQATAGIVVIPPADELAQSRFESQAISNRLEPGDETSIAFRVWYTVPHGGRGAVVTVTIALMDDNGFPITTEHEVMVED